ncbi:hypothetical protein AtubIFM61612_009967 [Aspergillus tubingensis]|nr:hypothetical protein AtubIFM61612_009967 [Aspergillus tubingensis]
MATESVPDANLSVKKDFGDIRGLQTEAKRQFDTDIILRNSLQGAPNRFEAKGRVLRASDVLLSLVGRSTSGMLPPGYLHMGAACGCICIG